MLPFRRLPRSNHPLIQVLSQIRDTAAHLRDDTRNILRDVAHTIRDLHDMKGLLVANFDALNQKLDEQDAARTAAVQRVAEDVQALKDQIAALELDTDDQAKVDAIVDRVQANVDALNAIDPVRADDTTVPAEEPTPAGGGEVPADGDQPQQ